MNTTMVKDCEDGLIGTGHVFLPYTWSRNRSKLRQRRNARRWLGAHRRHDIG